jgi:AraC family transcriptional regulator
MYEERLFPVGIIEPIFDGMRRAEFSAEAVRILDDIRRTFEQRPESARSAALQLVSLLTSPSGAGLAGARGGLAPWQKRKVEEYIRRHLQRPIHIDELAAQVTLSVSHFCRAFKETFGETPHACIIRHRLALARKLMLGTLDSLSQIALACGLGDQAHLTKLFKKGVGETPGAWRRRNATGDLAREKCPRAA